MTTITFPSWLLLQLLPFQSALLLKLPLSNFLLVPFLMLLAPVLKTPRPSQESSRSVTSRSSVTLVETVDSIPSLPLLKISFPKDRVDDGSVLSHGSRHSFFESPLAAVMSVEAFPDATLKNSSASFSFTPIPTAPVSSTPKINHLNSSAASLSGDVPSALVLPFDQPSISWSPLLVVLAIMFPLCLIKCLLRLFWRRQRLHLLT